MAETSPEEARDIPKTIVGGAGLRSVLAKNFDVWQAVGGVRGVIETTAPGLIFVIAFVVTEKLLPSVIAPLVASVVLILVRLFQRLDVVPALGGLFGVAASALFAWQSGQASNYFAMGLLSNAGYLAVLLLSILVRWPLMGLIVGFMRGDAVGWRRDPSQKMTKRRYWQATWLWVALFAVRLLIQLPLYLADATTALGVVKLLMGPGLFALIAWFTWMLVRNLPPVPESVDDDEAEDVIPQED